MEIAILTLITRGKYENLRRKTLDVIVDILYNFPIMKTDKNRDEPICILVIDDEPVIRELLDDVLSRKGYVVDTADNGEVGLAKAQETSYDVVFTDIRMPGISGVEVYRRIKVISPKSQVIVMTGYGLEEMIQQALDMGAFADVKKPFDLDAIYELVERALESRGANDSERDGSGSAH